MASITVTPTAAHSGATIQVRINAGTYATVASGSASGALALNPGLNNVDILVTAQDGTTSKTYTLAVTRQLAAAVSFASWSSNAPVTGPLVAKYAIGGATNAGATSESPLMTWTNGRLSLSAVVRTNDTNLTVNGQTGTDLSNWTTNGVAASPSADTGGVPEGFQRRIYSTDLTNNPSKQFLRLRATLNGQ